MYADDIVLWTTRISLRAMTTRMPKQLNKTAKFLSTNYFETSASKSQAVLFTNSRIKRSEANIRLRIRKEQIPNVHLFRNCPGRKTKLVCSCRGCQDTLHGTTKCNESHLWKLLGASKTNLLQVYRAIDRPGMQTDLRHIRQASVSSSEDLLWWREGNECLASASGMR